MFQADKIAAVALLVGEAVRMGSTPVSMVIAFTSDDAAPSAETSITASPFCRSASATVGSRPRNC